jgi:hypothetical protein
MEPGGGGCHLGVRFLQGGGARFHHRSWLCDLNLMGDTNAQRAGEGEWPTNGGALL